MSAFGCFISLGSMPHGSCESQGEVLFHAKSQNPSDPSPVLLSDKVSCAPETVKPELPLDTAAAKF
jgi:hypothetical protein